MASVPRKKTPSRVPPLPTSMYWKFRVLLVKGVPPLMLIWAVPTPVLVSTGEHEPVTVRAVSTVPAELLTTVSPDWELSDPLLPSQPVAPAVKLPSRATRWPALLTPSNKREKTVPAGTWGKGVVSGPTRTPSARMPVLSNSSIGPGPELVADSRVKRKVAAAALELISVSTPRPSPLKSIT